MQLSAPEPTPRARINWIREKEMLGKREGAVRSQCGENIGEERVGGGGGVGGPVEKVKEREGGVL